MYSQKPMNIKKTLERIEKVNINTSLKSIDAQIDRAETQITNSQKTLNEEKLSHKRFIRDHLKALRDGLDKDGLRFYSDHIQYLIKRL